MPNSQSSKPRKEMVMASGYAFLAETLILLKGFIAIYRKITLMKSLQQIKGLIDSLKPILNERFEVKTLELFGSYVRGEQTEKSDLDIFVTFREPNDVDPLNLLNSNYF